MSLPFDPKEELQPLTAAEAAEKLKAKTLQSDEAAKESVAGLLADLRKERLMNTPIVFKVGNKDYQFTSRPMGITQLVLAEFLKLGGIFKTLENEMNKGVEGGAVEDVVVSEDDIRAVFLSKGAEGMDVLTTIAQLLLEPPPKGEPQPIDLANLTVSRDAIQWGFTMQSFSRLLSEFMLRDVLFFGGQVKNLMGLSQM